jgi:hypothetical protein
MNSIRNLIADDSFAIGFQSMGQYRTALLKALDVTPPAPEVGEVGSDYDQAGAIAAVILDYSRVAASLGYPGPERNLGRVLRESDFGATARAILARWGNSAAPAPAVVPVAVSERLPGPEDCDEDGFCWMGYGYKLPGVDEKDSYAMWMLMPSEESSGEVWRPANAIPLPQAGEGEA